MKYALVLTAALGLAGCATPAPDVETRFDLRVQEIAEEQVRDVEVRYWAEYVDPEGRTARRNFGHAGTWDQCREAHRQAAAAARADGFFAWRGHCSLYVQDRLITRMRFVRQVWGQET